MSAKDEFSERLRAAMAAAGLEISGTELERAFNRKWKGTPISVQAVWGWINGRAFPRNDRLQVLAKLLRVDPHALLYGAPEPASAAERRREWEDRVTYAERESIEAFLRLPTPQRLIVRDVIATYAKAHGAVEPGKE
ncbi:MAG: transcriptional regulator [Pseudomonadota bacterium]|nr:transcriptional regulator [Pseudomonadota bacterium]